MTVFGEYTTVYNARKLYLASAQTADDEIILQFIRQVSREIDRLSGRYFYPVVETRKYDIPKNGGTDVYLDAEILELQAIDNNGAIDITEVLLYGSNELTKSKIRLLNSGGIWQSASNGSGDQAISITGIWTYIFDRTAGWLQATTLSGNITDSATTFAAVANSIKAGQLLKIGTEFLYVSSVAAPVSPAVTDTVTCIRACNGTVAAAHTAADVVYAWHPGYDIEMLASTAAVAYYNLKSNPLVSSYSIDGVTFYTPKDVTQFIKKKLLDLTLVKVGFA